MKRYFLILTVLFISIITNAQKFAYIDTEYILDKMPEYKEAQKELDKFSLQWQKEIESKYAEIDRLYKSYQAEQILLTEDMKKKRQEEILKKEKEAKELQRKRFGPDGDLFQKRQELVKPIQDKIYDAVKKIALLEGYVIIFDKSQTTMVYSNPRYDVSNKVLEKLGIQFENNK